MDPKGRKQRKYKRFMVDIMGIHGSMRFAKEVEILDLSLGGISIKTDKRLSIGSEHSFKIKDKERVLSLKGMVVWSLPGGTRKKSGGGTVAMYVAGIKFTEMTGEKTANIVEFIEKNRNELDEQKDPHGLSGLRCNIRFSMSPEEKAILDCPEHYKVKKLSLGGMLVEGEHALEMEHAFPMEVFLPGEHLIGFLGRIASCLPVYREGEMCFDIGIEFIDIPNPDREKLGKFLSTLHEEDTPSSES
jgi:Tfp pilus assembly protein PilZ